MGTHHGKLITSHQPGATRHLFVTKEEVRESLPASPDGPVRPRATLGGGRVKDTLSKYGGSH